jgi:hypothetical protein
MERRRCGAKLRGKDATCRKWARKGGRRCQLHGGNTPRAERAATLRLAEHSIRASLAEQGVEIIGDPVTTFQRIASEVVAFKDFAAAHVARLGERLTGYDEHDAEYLRAMVTLYERALDRAGKFLHDWIRLDLDARLVAVTEQQAQIVAQVITDVLRDLGHDIHQGEVARLVGHHLRLVQGDGR